MPPTTRALLLTDVVDSTKLSEALGDVAMARVWAAHDRVARDLLGPHRGREIDKTDGFLLLFESASDAVTYALAYHRAIAKLDPPLQARAGLHVGDVILTENSAADVALGAKPLEVDGFAKPTGARIMALALGGQTLLSDTARTALGEPSHGCELRSHGHYRLKGLAEPMELFELGVPGESPFAPPSDAAKAYRVVRSGDLWKPARDVRNSLPAERDAFVGRSADLHALATRLDDGERLVTVLGMGGTGKTRFVRRYGWTWLGDWPGGVYFCDLSEARSLSGIAGAVAGAMDVSLGKDDPIVQLGHAIAGRDRCLVILDNFEQVTELAGATVGRWMERAKNASFVVTSRELLAIPGEHVLPLEPLPTDGAGVELFVVRAQARKAGFALTPTNEKTVQEIVTLLDGLPLAIELAAARSAVLSPEQLLGRLKDRFQILVGARGVHARLATLRAAIDWSWTLLSPWEQAALAQASVFVGGFTLEAAERVIDLSAWPQAPMAMDVVQSLVDKSLLRVQSGRHDIDEPYFGMYVSIHEYAGEKLRTEGALPDGGSGAAAEAAALERHGGYFATFGTSEAVDALDTHGGVARRQALVLELENLVAACRRAVVRGDGATAVATFAAANAVLAMSGPFLLVAELGRLVLTLGTLDPCARALALHILGKGLRNAGRMDEARERLETALAIYRELGKRASEGAILCSVGMLHAAQGRIAEARACYESALAIACELGDRAGVGVIAGNQGNLEWGYGNREEARACYESALGIAIEVGSRAREGIILGNLGNMHWAQGRRKEGRECFEAALAIHREVGNRSAEGQLLGNFGNLHAEQDCMQEAQECYEAALQVHREIGDRPSEGIVMASLGRLHASLDRVEAARECFEAALAIHRDVGNKRFEGIVTVSLGELHAGERRMDVARGCYESALTIARDMHSPHLESHALGNLAVLHAMQGRTEEARECFASTLAIHRATGNRLGEGSVVGNLGILHHEQGRLDDARACYESALAIHREVGNRRDEGGVLGNLGLLHAEQGQLSEARACLESAQALNREVGNRRSEGSALGDLGLVLARMGQIEEARAMLAAGELLLRSVNDLTRLGTLTCRRAECERLARDLPAARMHLAEAEFLARELAAGPDSELGKQIAKLRALLDGGAAPSAG